MQLYSKENIDIELYLNIESDLILKSQYLRNKYIHSYVLLLLLLPETNRSLKEVAYRNTYDTSTFVLICSYEDLHKNKC